MRGLSVKRWNASTASLTRMPPSAGTRPASRRVTEPTRRRIHSSSSTSIRQSAPRLWQATDACRGTGQDEQRVAPGAVLGAAVEAQPVHMRANRRPAGFVVAPGEAGRQNEQGEAAALGEIGRGIYQYVPGG